MPLTFRAFDHRADLGKFAQRGKVHLWPFADRPSTPLNRALVFSFPIRPAQREITDAGRCVQQVMGDYYPVAVWCDVDTFKAKGWRAFYHAAGVQ